MAQRRHHKRTNDEWVAALRGDLGYRAQEEAYGDLADYLYVVAHNYLRSHKADIPRLRCKSNDQLAALAEDFTQNTLMRLALEQLYNRYRGEGRFLSYMAAVVLNEVRQELRGKKWQIYEEVLLPPELKYEPESGDRLPPFEPEAFPDSTPETWQLQREVWETIQQCVEQLPERWRRAFVWNVFEGLSATKVKDRLNAPSEQAVYNLINRARRRLKACLIEASWDLDDVWKLFS
jgi:RNA polymerase sigma factor (sigma-70 family)